MGIKLDIQKEIEDYKLEILEKNNAVEVTKNVAIDVATKVQMAFNKFSQTESIDERIQTLINVCREVVQLTEDSHNNLEKQISDINLKVKTLEDLLAKLGKHFEVKEKVVVHESPQNVIQEDSEEQVSEEIVEGKKK